MIKFLSIVDKTPSLLTRSRRPNVLYHYTSQQGLLGMVARKKLWATHIRYLNDSKELDYALELARERLFKERDSGDKRRSKFAQAALSDLEGSLDIDMPFTVYVTSFSRHRDQLSQWRGYCPRGSGFSLGFKVSKLLRLVERRSSEFDLTFVPCLYDEDKQNALISELVSTALTTPTDASPQSLFVLLMLRWAPAIKHRTFKEEAEWRLVARGVRSDSLFREGGSFLIPYVEFDLQNEGKEAIHYIESVTLGPTPHPELSEQAVADLLDQHGTDQTITFRSEIPFRSW